MNNKNIAIDGPAGAGKSTIAKKIAVQLSAVYVDTGAMYRAIALHMIRNNIKEADMTSLKKELETIELTLEYRDKEQQVILNGENVNALIRTEEVGKGASAYAKIKEVREKLVELQREMAKRIQVVMDGRDIGTHVLPDAAVKIYLTAEVSVRARRRWKELKEKGLEPSLQEIEEDIAARDQQDMNREISPLRQAVDAILVDTSECTIDEVVERIKEIYQKKVEK